jgi:ankyrin repeat protein
VGSWDEVKIIPAIMPTGHKTGDTAAINGSESRSSSSHSGVVPRKKDIKSFHDLLNHFPVIAKQMQPGLEKLFREFTTVFLRPLPPPPSADHIPDPEPDGPITAAMRKVRSNSASSRSNGDGRDHAIPPTENFYAEDDEDVMRASLETAVTAAIDLFQSVDKQQLSLLGATTDLTGPLVERLIERFVTENVHHLLFPRLSALKRLEDLELEAKIRQMDFIDISQLGIAVDGGWSSKRGLITSLGSAIEEFRKMSSAMSPQETMDILLQTTKAVTQLSDPSTTSEKPTLTINADTLVSLLLYVVIKAQIKHLQARLIYIRHFIFIDDVDSGEMGYALSTFEAVLSYLNRDSSGLRRASRRNKALWDAAAKGDLVELTKIMEPSADAVEEEENCVFESPISSRRPSVSSWSMANGTSRRSSSVFTVSERFSLGSGLNHVFPFQNQEGEENFEPMLALPRKLKKVAMDTRSMSSGSEISFHSHAASFGTIGSGLEGDTSIERLAQTRDSFGESVHMMAVQNQRPEILSYLLSLKQFYPPRIITDDRNNEGTTLFSAAVQLGQPDVVRVILDYLVEMLPQEELCLYFATQDERGRSAAHYLFHAPFLIRQIGKFLPWRQRDQNGQTPLFALCRSYDHALYHKMVEEGLNMATEMQGDGQPLHLDDHVDGKGNTLLHIVNDASLVMRILQRCDVDVNATNEKKFTALMVASKYGRFDMVRALFSDPRVDIGAKELRGLTAVELAKDDDVRNKIDDLTLFSLPAGPDSRTTGVVRSYFVEDATIRFVLKSGAPVDAHSYAVTTCRRSLADFEHLAKLLAMENPASWIPSLANLRSPTQVPSKPSRAVLKDLQLRMDWFLRVLLIHPTFATHEMLWEFFLVPDLQSDMMDERSKLKAETRAETVRDELTPLEDVREVEQFVNHAREMVRSIHFSTRSVARRTSIIANATSGMSCFLLRRPTITVRLTCVFCNLDLHEASQLLVEGASTLVFLPETYVAALNTYVRSLLPSQSSPVLTFYGAFTTLHSIVESILKALSRPAQLISQIANARRDAERSLSSLSRSTRWPLGLLDDTRQRLHDEREERARRSEVEAQNLGKELRYTQQTVANELAGWRAVHEKIGRRAIRELARGMLIAEKSRLDGMRRALRRVKEAGMDLASAGYGGVMDGETMFAEGGGEESISSPAETRSNVTGDQEMNSAATHVSANGEEVAES